MPAGAPRAAAPVTAGLTLLVIVVAALRGAGLWRLWGPVVGIVVGSVTGGLFGIYDASGILTADCIGLPPIAYPGLDLGFGPAFWALLPAFVLVTAVGAMVRSIQGAMSADGVGNLLSGLAGTIPNTTYASSISIVELTGVAARAVGVCVGLIFLVMAFIPKLAAVLVAIPGPVIAAYFVAVLALLFMFGVKILQNEGLDYRNRLVVGLAFWIGLAFQLDWIFPEYFQGH